MSNGISSFSSDYSYILGFLSKSTSQYKIPSESLKKPCIFFSKEFLKDKNWSVIPLWGTDLTQLIGLDGLNINLVHKISDFYTQTKSKNIFYAMVEEFEKLWYADFPTIVIAGKKIDMSNRLDEFFGIRGQGKDRIGPYMGNSFLWPEDESFLIFSDGDNLAFIAGDLLKLENLLQVQYNYCMQQYLSFNSSQQSIPELYLWLANFCNESLKK